MRSKVSLCLVVLFLILATALFAAVHFMGKPVGINCNCLGQQITSISRF